MANKNPQRKKPETLEEYLNIRRSVTSGRTDYLSERYKKSLKKALGLRKDGNNEMDFIEEYGVSIGKYSLKTWIKRNPWLRNGRPSTQAIKWLFREVLKNPTKYQYRKQNMFVGGLFSFEYKNPKYKGSKRLPWFDKYPLVLSLGPIVTNQGVRNMGFNLHLLPPKVRIVVLVKTFEIYKRLYRYQIFFKRDRPVPIKYQTITKMLAPYGVMFALRMYIPKRQRAVIHFPYREWHKAVFVPSRGYDSIKAGNLIREWNKYIRKLGYATRSNIDWESKI